jgi:trimethylamine:corrinoid methyltransferase-like protein
LVIDLIKRLGSEGNYLVENHTLTRCRNEFYIPELGMRKGYAQWREMEDKDIKDRAKHLVDVRLSSYEIPYIERMIIKQLNRYVDERKVKVQEY